MVRLKKVALHEIGQNLGLVHCRNHLECLMNDADGTIKQVDKERIWFCEKCWINLYQFFFFIDDNIKLTPTTKSTIFQIILPYAIFING